MTQAVSADRASSAGMAAMVAAVASLVLFILAVTEIVDEWGYIASIALGVVAVVLGLLARRRSSGTGMALLGMVLGGLMVALQVGWLILNAAGVVAD